MSTINPVQTAPFVPSVSPHSTPASTSSSFSVPRGIEDLVELSLAGRIALGVGDGNLTSDQGQQLDSQLQAVTQQIQGGGSGIGQLQNQLSEQIYGDAHNGASIPADINVTLADKRDFLQAGRVVAQQSAGNLTSTQASQFFSQIYQQAQSTASPSSINQSQNQISVEIYDAAHNVNSGGIQSQTGT